MIKDTSIIPVFILGYGSSTTLDKWFDATLFDPRIQFFIVDNGKQTYSAKLQPYVIYSTGVNIGCAGGWNLICEIAFSDYKFDKIIISNEDNFFTNEWILDIWDKSTDTNIQGCYDRAFEFSLFGLTKQLYKTVGRFDENFLMASSEDLDYKYRCKLLNYTVSSLNISADYNASETGGDTIPDYQRLNHWYYQFKWGHETFKTPFSLKVMDKPFKTGFFVDFWNNRILSTGLEEKLWSVITEGDLFPSELETALYRTQMIKK